MEKEKQTQTQAPKLPHVQKIDLTYQTYRKALFDCIGEVSEIIKNSSAFLAVDIPQYVQLLNMLNGQLVQVEAFLADYQQVDETV